MFINHTRGFTLLEVLVSLVIMSVGLLGLAGLHLSGLQGNQGALFRTQVTLISNDLATRMRSNRTGIDANNYASNVNTPTADYTKACANLNTVDCDAAACTSAEMSAFDVADFICAINAAIPTQPTVNVTCADNDITDADTCTNGSPHTISVNWTQRAANNANANNELNDLTNNNNLTLVVRP